MASEKIKDSELLVNRDGSIFHLHLKPGQLADKIILVGDPGRVAMVSHYFDQIECKVANREFISHTGTFEGERITVISTGIGTDNIDIVMNEIDALANIDLNLRKPLDQRKKLVVVRLGTSGALQEDIRPGALVTSSHALGLDGLKYYYSIDPAKEDYDLANAIANHLDWDVRFAQPYVSQGTAPLVSLLGSTMTKGITATATGFYGPQGRQLAIPIRYRDLPKQMASFKRNDLRITNMEMESGALYLLAELMNHEACTCCAILANRITGQYSKQHDAIINRLIQTVLPKLAGYQQSKAQIN